MPRAMDVLQTETIGSCQCSNGVNGVRTTLCIWVSRLLYISCGVKWPPTHTPLFDSRNDINFFFFFNVSQGETLIWMGRLFSHKPSEALTLWHCLQTLIDQRTLLNFGGMGEIGVGVLLGKTVVSGAHTCVCAAFLLSTVFSRWRDSKATDAQNPTWLSIWVHSNVSTYVWRKPRRRWFPDQLQRLKQKSVAHYFFQGQ